MKKDTVLVVKKRTPQSVATSVTYSDLKKEGLGLLDGASQVIITPVNGHVKTVRALTRAGLAGRWTLVLLLPTPIDGKGPFREYCGAVAMELGEALATVDAMVPGAVRSREYPSLASFLTRQGPQQGVVLKGENCSMLATFGNSQNACASLAMLEMSALAVVPLQESRLEEQDMADLAEFAHQLGRRARGVLAHAEPLSDEDRERARAIRDKYKKKAWYVAGESDDILRFWLRIPDLLESKGPIVFQGPIGAGKSWLAKALGAIRGKKIVSVDAGRLSPELVGSELFGHVEGAFTGASKDKTGYVADVGDGTLILDNMQGMPRQCQAAMLEFLQTRVFVKVGGTAEEQSRAQLVFTFNEAPETLVSAGRLLPDLWSRLEVGPQLYLSPLSERIEDVEPILRQVAARERLTYENTIATPEYQDLESKGFPCTVRYLVEALPAKAAKSKAKLGGRRLSEEQRNEIIEKLRAGGSPTILAKEYGVSRATIYKIKKKIDG